MPGSLGKTHMIRRRRNVQVLPNCVCPRRAAQRLRRLAEGADEGAAHPLGIAKAGLSRDAFDRLAEDCTLARATSILKRSIAFDGVAPVSAMKARVKCRELMPARSARSSTVSGASRCSRAHVKSDPKTAARGLQFQQRGELRLPAAAAVIQHELARGLLRDFLAVIFRYQRQREVDAGGDARGTPDIAVADENPSGSSFTRG